MKRTTLLKWLNLILAVLLVNQIATGMFADSLSPKTFELMHQGGGILFAVLALLHVILNWGWIKANYFKHRTPAAS